MIASAREPATRRASPAARAGLRWALLVATSVPAVASAQILSPGKLSAAHGAYDRACKDCHGERAGKVTAARCLACHQPLARRIAAGKGFHARRKQSCTSCHQEHKGRGHALIRWPAGGMRAFDHRATGFVLRGKHAQRACRDCHQPKRQRDAAVRALSSRRRARTFLGLASDCASCHRDPHQNTAGGRCASCHTEQGFKPVRSYAGHARSAFPLRGKHREQPCARCHQRAGKWVFKGVTRSCEGCHKTPHKGFMARGRSDTTLGCSTCHDEQSFKAIRFAREQHPSQIPLRGGHARAPCRACHGPQAARKPKGTTCTSCHRDTHEQRFGHRCSECHSPGSWRVHPTRIPSTGELSHEQRDSAILAGVPLAKLKHVVFHNKTRFPLTGKHIIVRCQRCHKQGRRRGQRSRIKFTRGYARCADCHTDEHAGQFSEHVTVNARRAGECEACHPLGGLSITSFSPARHAKSRFPLRGVHRAVPCQRCHSKRRAKARRFTYERLDCAACHRDKHRGRYRLEASASGPLPCAKCHTETSFAAIRFDHSKTRFPLVGRHAKVACTSCHRPDARGVTLFAGRGRSCESCHADPHQGQFRLAGRPRACSDCHDPAAGKFKVARFDHDKRTRFALRGKHRTLDCSRCHRQLTLRDGRRARLFRLGTTSCRSCHESRHREATVRARSAAATAARRDAAQQLERCELCHDPRGWRLLPRKPPRFEHDVVGYRLEGRHRAAACAACHRPDRAISRQCSSCHADRHAGRLGRNCAECHRPTSWRPSDVLARHRRTRLPLTGRHALIDCASCHPRARDGVFRGVPATCYGCHAAQYNDPARHPNHIKAGYGRNCEQCHRPTGWYPAAFAQRSSALTARPHRFPLAGRHARLACATCHVSKQQPSSRCVSCHDADRRRVRSPNHTSPTFSRDCARCHSDRGWRPARAPAHDRRFPLRGQHRAMDCTSCHYDATSFARTTCIACHDRAAMTRAHRRVTGYVFASAACRRCHSQGRR